MKMNKIIIFSIVLAVIYIGVFFVPNRVEKFALVPGKIFEVWRFVTYSFTHLNARHLIENMMGLGIVAFIARELKTAFSDFSSAHLSTGLLSALPVWLILQFTALGASNAILGCFGLITQEVKKFNIKRWYIIALLLVVIFLKSITSYFSYGSASEQFAFAFKQSISHFSGFVAGIGVFFLLARIKPILTKKKRHVLRGDYR